MKCLGTLYSRATTSTFWIALTSGWTDCENTSPTTNRQFRSLQSHAIRVFAMIIDAWEICDWSICLEELNVAKLALHRVRHGCNIGMTILLQHAQLTSSYSASTISQGKIVARRLKKVGTRLVSISIYVAEQFSGVIVIPRASRGLISGEFRPSSPIFLRSSKSTAKTHSLRYPEKVWS